MALNLSFLPDSKDGKKQSSKPPKYKASNPFIFQYGCDLWHRPFTTPKRIANKKRRENFDPRRYSYRKEHNGYSYVPYKVPAGWRELTDDETGETIYMNLLTNVSQEEKPMEEATTQGMKVRSLLGKSLRSPLPDRYPKYLKLRAMKFIEDVNLLHGTYKNRAISPVEFEKNYNDALQGFEYKKGSQDLSEVETDSEARSKRSSKVGSTGSSSLGKVKHKGKYRHAGSKSESRSTRSIQGVSSGGSSLGNIPYPDSSSLGPPLAPYRNLSTASFESIEQTLRAAGSPSQAYTLSSPYQSFHTAWDMSLNEEQPGEASESLEDGDIKSYASREVFFYNSLRIGNIFCLWCGQGPMPAQCRGSACLPLSRCHAGLRLPHSISLCRHKDPCKKHNHIFPRGMCPGRCPDCGGCNMGESCTHYNPSGGPLHPNGKNLESVPNCSKTDGSRCFREDLLLVQDPVRKRPPSRPRSQPVHSHSKGKARKGKGAKTGQTASGSSNSSSGRLSRPSSKEKGSKKGTPKSRPASRQKTDKPASRPSSKGKSNASLQKSSSRPNSKSGGRASSRPNSKDSERPRSRRSGKPPIPKTKEGLGVSAPRVRPKSSPALRRVKSTTGADKHRRLLQKAKKAAGNIKTSKKHSDSSLILAGKSKQVSKKAPTGKKRK